MNPSQPGRKSRVHGRCAPVRDHGITNDVATTRFGTKIPRSEVERHIVLAMQKIPWKATVSDMKQHGAGLAKFSYGVLEDILEDLRARAIVIVESEIRLPRRERSTVYMLVDHQEVTRG